MRAVPSLVLAALIAAAAPAQAQNDEKKAITEIERAVELYKQGEYREAAAGFLRAYQLVKRPVQLRNAAKSFEQAEMLEEALETWAQFRDHAGLSPEDRSEARAHIEMINAKKREQAAIEAAEAAKAEAAKARAEAEAAKTKAAEEARARAEAEQRASAEKPPPIVQGPIAVEPEKHGPPVWAMAMVGVGAGLGVASVVVYVLARNQAADIEEQAQAVVNRGATVDEAKRQFAEANGDVDTQLTLSLVLAIAGGATLGTGLYFVLWDDSEMEVAPAPGGARVSLKF